MIDPSFSTAAQRFAAMGVAVKAYQSAAAPVQAHSPCAQAGGAGPLSYCRAGQAAGGRIGMWAAIRLWLNTYGTDRRSSVWYNRITLKIASN